MPTFSYHSSFHAQSSRHWLIALICCCLSSHSFHPRGFMLNSEGRNQDMHLFTCRGQHKSLGNRLTDWLTDGHLANHWSTPVLFLLFWTFSPCSLLFLICRWASAADSFDLGALANIWQLELPPFPLPFCHLGAQQTWTLSGISPSPVPHICILWLSHLASRQLERRSWKGNGDSSEVLKGAAFLLLS